MQHGFIDSTIEIQDAAQHEIVRSISRARPTGGDPGTHKRHNRGGERLGEGLPLQGGRETRGVMKRFFSRCVLFFYLVASGVR